MIITPNRNAIGLEVGEDQSESFAVWWQLKSDLDLEYPQISVYGETFWSDGNKTWMSLGNGIEPDRLEEYKSVFTKLEQDYLKQKNV